MKVFADTIFLVSAFATRGLSADVFQLILSKHELQTGEFNLMELWRILREKLKLPQPVADEVDNLLRQHHVEPVPEQPSEFIVRDPDDRWVLASARNAGAQILITGDQDLLDVADQIDSIHILTPRGFWELERSGCNLS
jgi:putative PIN family toxin of toxin-antitoxin system